MGCLCSLHGRYTLDRMTIVPLSTYLKMYRKRIGFTHEEIAFLLGCMSGSTVSRHECLDRLPLLRTALMYELILGTSVGALYAGLFNNSAELVRERARGLRLSLEKRPRSQARDQKIAALDRIIGDSGLQ